MTWGDRSVLVTGANGFIGSWLTRRLVVEGAQVVAMIHDLEPQSEFVRAGLGERVRVVEGRLEDERTVVSAIADHAVDTVFHLGAQTIVETAHRDPVGTFEANIRGTYLLLEACRAADRAVKVVVASSDKAYGAVEQLPYTEETPLAGKQPYEVSKTCTDLLAQAYAHSYALPVAIARCGNVYGGGDLNWSRIVPGTIRALLGGVTPLIRSDGTFVRDYLHVHDVVDAYLTLAAWLSDDDTAARSGGLAFNFSDESPRTVLEIYDAICQAMGRHVEPEVLGHAVGEIHDQYLDARRAHDELGWKARVDLHDGLRRTVEWYSTLFGSA